MPAMATDLQEFAAVPLTPPNPGESVGAKEYYKVVSSTVTRKFRLLGRAAVEQEMLIGASSSTPTITATGTHADTSLSVAAGSTDAVGTAIFTTASTGDAGTNVKITFGTALAAAPRAVMLTILAGGTGQPAGAMVQALNLLAASFDIGFLAAPQTATAFSVMYVVIP